MTNEEFEKLLETLDAENLVLLKWHSIRRPEQVPPDPLPPILFYMGGRGSGKTYMAVNHIFEWCYNLPWIPEYDVIRIALVGDTAKDCKGTMIEGVTGLKSIVPKDLIVDDHRSLGEFSFRLRGPNGKERLVKTQAYSSEAPGQLRGPQFNLIWMDEPSKMKDSDVNPETPDCTWSNAMFGLRLGKNPHCIVTGTPDNCRLVKYLKNHPDCTTITMSSLDNTSLPKLQKDMFNRLNPNSRLYRQEVLGQLVEDNPDSLFNLDIINENRKDVPEDVEYELILGWDPAASSNPDSDEAGIVLVASTREHLDESRPKDTRPQGYVLEDHSGHFSPQAQADIVAALILENEVEVLVFERNQGSGFVQTALITALQNHPLSEGQQIKSRKLSGKSTKLGQVERWKIICPTHSFILSSIHAKVGKQLRAETVALRYESQDIHHPVAALFELEDQMTSWDPDPSTGTKRSPDRLDAVVYALLYIFGYEAMRGHRRSGSTMASPVKALTPRSGGLAGVYSLDIGSGRAAPPVGVSAEEVEAALSNRNSWMYRTL